MKARKTLLILFILLITTTTIVQAKVTYNMQICGGSMRPTFNLNKECGVYQVQTIRANETKINDTVCYTPDWRHYARKNMYNVRYVCHRIIDKNETHIRAKGDNNPVAEPWIPNKRVALIILGEKQ